MPVIELLGHEALVLLGSGYGWPLQHCAETVAETAYEQRPHLADKLAVQIEAILAGPVNPDDYWSKKFPHDTADADLNREGATKAAIAAAVEQAALVEMARQHAE